MNREALSMAKHLTNAAARNEVNTQYHWANLLVLDALARGAKGPEAEQTDARRYMDNHDRLTPDGEAKLRRMNQWTASSTEDAIEEARR